MKDDRVDAGHLRRRGPRVVGPFKGRWCGALKVPLVIHDLSVGGCMILSSNATLPSDIMTIEIDMPTGECITVQAEPLYIRKSVGFAVRFVNVPDATDMRLQRLITAIVTAGGKTSPRRP